MAKRKTSTWLLLHSDARHIPLADESVQCVVTSPPYWGLRDYKLHPTVWGGREDCEHQWGPARKIPQTTHWNTGGVFDPEKRKMVQESKEIGQFCSCGAWLGTLGLEPTPELYVQHIVEIFREVRRVLRKDGTLWLNVGDCYATQPAGNFGSGTKPGDGGAFRAAKPYSTVVGNFKPKDLVGIPWRVAFALQADGWWLRSDIIWAKPNPMPESVTDRPTKAHEYLFLLTKSEKYYWDQEAVREPAQDWGLRDRTNWRGKFNSPQGPQMGCTNANHAESGRNIRTVWTIATQPFPDAHFATFPEKLVEPCIKAGSKMGDVVLDPFSGSGTVGVVALKHGRSFVGLDLQPTYLDMARKRIENDAPLFNRVVGRRTHGKT